MIPGLTDSNYEFFFENGEIYLIHNGVTMKWNEITDEILSHINDAFNSYKVAVIRSHIREHIQDKNERLREFVRICWGELDYTPDMTENFEFNFESLEDYNLTPRELEFMRLVCMDLTDNEIAYRMKISYNTAITHHQNIANKIGAKSKLGIALFSYKRGIV